MIVNYDKYLETKEELERIDRTNPFNVVGAYINILVSYNKDNQDNFFELMQYLMGEYQPLSNLAKQGVNDRMNQNDKYKFIGKSYFMGATPENDYTPELPLRVEVKTNPYTDENEGYKRLFVKSGGADLDRPITVRLAKDGNYYIWSDSYMGLLTDIRKPESENPWA